MRFVLSGVVAAVVLLVCASGNVDACTCPYALCEYDIQTGLERQAPGSDAFCCDYAASLQRPLPCSAWPGSEECWELKQKFTSPAAARGIGSGDLYGVVHGVFTFDLFLGECDFDEDVCKYTLDPNGSYVGFTDVCCICV